MAGKDYYDLLGIPKSAPDKDVKSAYRRLARKYHPDVNPGDKSAEAKFKEINEAFEVLSDPDKRRKFDQYGSDFDNAEAFARARQQSQQQSQRQSGNFNRGARGSPFTGGEAQDMGDLNEVFESLFRGMGGGGARTGGRRAPRKGQDIEHQIELLSLIHI